MEPTKLDTFDGIAGVYDRLSQLVFGNAIQQAQLYFLHTISKQSNILVIGGGSGLFLRDLLLVNAGCTIWYIEASQKMIQLSKTNLCNSNRVHFIHGTEDAIPCEIRFDVVITNFYLDLFSEKELINIVRKIHRALKPNGQWLVSDFVLTKKWWHSAMLAIMYKFFRITCSVTAAQLPDWNKRLSQLQFTKEESNYFWNGFIETAVFQVPPPY